MQWGSSMWQKFKGNKRAVVGAVVGGVFAVLAAVGVDYPAGARVVATEAVCWVVRCGDN